MAIDVAETMHHAVYVCTYAILVCSTQLMSILTKTIFDTTIVLLLDKHHMHLDIS